MRQPIRIKLPDPDGKPSEHLASLEIPLHRYSAADARSMADTVVGALVTLAKDIENNQNILKDLDSEIKRLDGEIPKLRAAKQEALDEVRRGLICTACGRTPSELRRDGVYDVIGHASSFSQDGQLQPLPLTEIQRRLKEKGEEYDKKIADAVAKREQATAARTQKDEENGSSGKCVPTLMKTEEF